MITKEPRRVGDDTHWMAIAMSANLLAAVTVEGALVENDTSRYPLFGTGCSRKPSRHSDWIAVTTDGSDTSVALAADGTLSCWFRPPEETADGRALLGPTRKPLWSLNILESIRRSP